MNDLNTEGPAFKAICEEAEKLLGMQIEVEMKDAVERILSIARYQIDVRTAVEQGASQP